MGATPKVFCKDRKTHVGGRIAVTNEELMTMKFPNINKMIEYLPLIGLLQAVGSSQSLDAKAKAAIGLLQFVAAKTDTALDNELVMHLGACLRTQAGMDLLAWLIARAASVVEAEKVSRQMGSAQ